MKKFLHHVLLYACLSLSVGQVHRTSENAETPSIRYNGRFLTPTKADADAYKSGISLDIDIRECIVSVLNTDVTYAAIDKTCHCQTTVPGHGVVVEWIEESTGLCLDHGVDIAKLKLAQKYVGSNITCKARHISVQGFPLQLPPIIYGPGDVHISLDNSVQELYTNENCLSFIYFRCSIDKKSVFPSAKIKGLITITVGNRVIRDVAKTIADVDSDDTFTLHFKYQFMLEGSVRIQCVATNSVLERFRSVNSTTLQIHAGCVRRRRRSESRSMPPRDIIQGRATIGTHEYVPGAVIKMCTMTVGSVTYADASKPCVCRALSHPNLNLSVTTEWVHSEVEARLSEGKETAVLNLTADIINERTTIFCRARTKMATGPAVFLPKIIHGPRKVELLVENEIDKPFYILKTCPQAKHFDFKCRVPKDGVFPRPTTVLQTSFSRRIQRKSSIGLPEIQNVVTVGEVGPDDYVMEGKFTIYSFSLPMPTTGTLTVACVATNSMQPKLKAKDEKIIQVTESSMKPTISSIPEGLSTDGYFMIPQYEQNDVSIVCRAPWDKDNKLILSLRCGWAEKALSGANEVKIYINISEINNGTICICNMALTGCDMAGESKTRLYFYEPLERVTSSTTTTESGAGVSDPEAHVGDDGSAQATSGLYIGIGVGVTLCVVLVAILCFIVGYKVGTKKTKKKMASGVNIGKVSFNSNSNVILQPSPGYEYLPEREPLTEAYTDNGQARAQLEDSYSHIDYIYHDNKDESAQYEQTTTKDKKKKTQLPPRSAPANEHLYDQANVYDRPQEQTTNSVYYDGYSKPIIN